MGKNRFEIARDEWERFGADILFGRTISPKDVSAFMKKNGEAVSIALLNASKEK